MALFANISTKLSILQEPILYRGFHLSAAVSRVQAGRYKPTLKKNKPLTYEMANPPHQINHRKAWNSWNTSNLKDGNRPSETAVEDVFIRRFMVGTWPTLILSEVIIKRQHNLIRIAAVMYRGIRPGKFYFLIGYTEELLSYWLQCPVKLELVTAYSRKDTIFKYI